MTNSLFLTVRTKTGRPVQVLMIPLFGGRESFALQQVRDVDRDQTIGLLATWSGRLAKDINSPLVVSTLRTPAVIRKCTERSDNSA
jgi:hypothetical protein